MQQSIVGMLYFSRILGFYINAKNAIYAKLSHQLLSLFIWCEFGSIINSMHFQFYGHVTLEEHDMLILL